MLMLQIPRDINAADLAHLIRTIGAWVGRETMAGVTAEFGRVIAGGHDVTDKMPLTSASLSSAAPIPPPPGSEDDEDDSAAPPPPASGPVMLDSEGLPWDGRIHSSKKTVNADGSWKARKGFGKETTTYQTIVAEYRKTYPAPVKAAPPPPPAAAETQAAAPPPPPPPGGMDFNGLMRKIGPMLQAKTINSADLNSLAAQVGLVTAPDLAAHPEKVADFNMMLDILLVGKNV
jgi:hypothetical protein